MTSIATTRLRKEYQEIKKKPIENIHAAPKESNILEWHYVIEGAEGSPYEGGFFHGVVTFPREYPYKPPSIQMSTPNGRFQINTRLCLSMSDFHPESWNPMWSTSRILLGLYSFMLEDQPTTGSIDTTVEEKRAFAKTSLAYNIQNKNFTKLFPELVTLYEEQQKTPPPVPAPETVFTAINDLSKELTHLAVTETTPSTTPSIAPTPSDTTISIETEVSIAGVESSEASK